MERDGEGATNPSPLDAALASRVRGGPHFWHVRMPGGVKLRSRNLLLEARNLRTETHAGVLEKIWLSANSQLPKMCGTDTVAHLNCIFERLQTSRMLLILCQKGAKYFPPPRQNLCTNEASRGGVWPRPPWDFNKNQ